MLPHLTNRLRSWKAHFAAKHPQLALDAERPTLWQLAQLPKEALPKVVQESAAAMKYLQLLGKLDWQHFPERTPERAWPGPKPAPHAPFCAALLVKVDKGLKSMSALRDELVQQPILTWLLGFPLKPSTAYACGFDVAASLPTHRHWSRLLREMPHEQLAFLLRSSLQLLQSQCVT